MTKVKVIKDPTPKQAKLIEVATENARNRQNTLSKGEMLIEAGYSPAVALQPSRIFSSPVIKAGLQGLLDGFDQKRRLVLQHITEFKAMTASNRENAYVVDLLTKNHQLLSGKSTGGGLINADKVVVILNQKDYADRVARTTEAGSST